MKPFQFKLEKVLEYRRLLEDQAKLALAKALAERDRAAALLASLEEQSREQDLALERKKDLTPAYLWLWRIYKNRLLQEIALAQEDLAVKEYTVSRCRIAAVERSKERKLLEKYKSNQAARHDREQLLAEQKEFDESSTLRFRHEAV